MLQSGRVRGPRVPGVRVHEARPHTPAVTGRLAKEGRCAVDRSGAPVRDRLDILAGRAETVATHSDIVTKDMTV